MDQLEKNNTSSKIVHKEFMGHPIGLFVCFFTEMWERFSFYGMKALMIFYLTKYHLFSDAQGFGIKGSYAALVYAIPLFGGMIADKYLGFRKAVVFGAILLTLGHLGMAFEGHEASINAAGEILRDNSALQVFYLSLGFIIMGVGFLKPNISSIVGKLYGDNDPRRSRGFNIFYMGINLGSFLATIICGYLGENLGWSWGFGAAGIGMFFGLIVFYFGAKYLGGVAEPPNPLKKSTEYTIYGVAVLAVILNMLLVQNELVVGWLLGLSSLFAIVYILYKTFANEEKLVHSQFILKRNHMLILLLMIFSSTFFWALFEQSYNSMNLYADRVVDRVLNIDLGFFTIGEIPASTLLGLNPLFIILLVPVVNALFSYLNKRKMEPNPLMKFSFALVLVGIGFGALTFGISSANVASVTEGGIQKVHLIFIVLAYFLHTSGELFLSPVGLSTISKFSLKSLLGLMMGTWFLATAGSEFIAAQLSKIASIDSHDSNVSDIGTAMTKYDELFTFLLYTGIVSGAVLFVLSLVFKNVLKEDE